jgi:hypothetical protein
VTWYLCTIQFTTYIKNICISYHPTKAAFVLLSFYQYPRTLAICWANSHSSLFLGQRHIINISLSGLVSSLLSSKHPGDDIRLASAVGVDCVKARKVGVV